MLSAEKARDLGLTRTRGVVRAIVKELRAINDISERLEKTDWVISDSDELLFDHVYIRRHRA